MTMTTATVWTPDGPRHFNLGQEYPSPEQGESMKEHSFEDKAPLPEEVPSEKWEKRNRLSNALANAAHEASKLEDDFDYQYRFNQDLVEQLAEARKNFNSALEELNFATAAYAASLDQERSLREWQVGEQREEVERLSGMYKDAVKRLDGMAVELRCHECHSSGWFWAGVACLGLVVATAVASCVAGACEKPAGALDGACVPGKLGPIEGR